MTQVIIDDVIPRTQLVAAPGQTVFNTNWTADVSSDILVYARADGVPPDDVTQLVSDTDYTVTFIGGSQTVRVTFLAGRTLDDVITIVRDTPAERTNLYINTNFVPSMLNQDFGILTLVDQQAQMYDIVVNPGYNVSATIEDIVDTVLPVLEANQTWVMNETRTKIIAYNVPSGGGVAPAGAKYLLQVADSDLPNAQAMGSLPSGIVVNATATGVQLTRSISGTAGQISISNGNGIAGNPTVSIESNPIIPGTAGMGIPQGTTAERVTPSFGIGLRYNTDLQDVEFWDGTQWVQFIDPSGQPLSGTDDTNVTLTLGGSPLTALLAATSLTLGWAGQLSPDRGGTGVDNGSSTLTLGGSLTTSGSFTSNFTMTGNTTVTFPTSGTLATTGQIPAGAALTKTDDTNVTLTLGGSPGIALVNATSLTLGWTGVLSIARGGTSSSSVISTPTAGSWAGWDANANIAGVNVLGGLTTIVSAGGTTVLTVASTYNQLVTGTLTQTFTMPVVTTLLPGHPFKIMNNSSANVTLNSSGGNLILTMAPNTSAFLTCALNTGTTAASWNSSYVFDNGAGVLSITGTANQVIASASTGAITLSLPQDIAATSSPTFAALTLTSPLTAPNGGSGRATAVAYSVLCGGTTTTGAHQSVASVGTVGQALLSAGPGALPAFGNLDAVLLSSVSISNQASVSFTGMTGYNNYMFIYNGITPATNGANLMVQTSSDNGSTWYTTAGDYYGSGVSSVGGVAAGGISLVQTAIIPANNVSSSSPEVCGNLFLTGMTTAVRKGYVLQCVYFSSTSVLSSFSLAGMINPLFVMNAARFLFSAGNISVGQIQLYGLR